MRPPHQWSRGARGALPAATLGLPTYLVLSMAFIVASFVIDGRGDGLADSLFPIVFGLHLLTMLASIALLTIYIVDVFNNPHIKGNRKALWAVVIFFGSFIAMPVYWWLYIHSKAQQSGRFSSQEAPA